MSSTLKLRTSTGSVHTSSVTDHPRITDSGPREMCTYRYNSPSSEAVRCCINQCRLCSAQAVSSQRKLLTRLFGSPPEVLIRLLIHAWYLSTLRRISCPPRINATFTGRAQHHFIYASSMLFVTNCAFTAYVQTPRTASPPEALAVHLRIDDNAPHTRRPLHADLPTGSARTASFTHGRCCSA